MRTSNNETSSGAAAIETEDRDIELENIIGNLLIAEYQVDKLRNRLVDKISPSYSSAGAKDHSAYSFKIGSKWYRVSIKVEEQRLALETAGKE
ncbi:hypothetical protein Ngar_c31580 [Candidatus Nitrososphaera gargensis Ga9.2]|uniref:Uncharacterized protein n=1 Tax=Nitrososphaera gargensis (strain Ga9.2) TaxID=1237085 RepID=K0INW3_NITGG|nr:hypothetical protein [Candidatus Nitrososphaera gargensis]AFU60074.1 hypothetical protein Ngar_c31580 [Candidatus Nitrososphaera gargensis Ga9.2]